MTRTFSAGFLYCGLGAGALGFLEACGQLGRDSARFVNVGGIDIDDAACADFEYLTGARATRADVSAMTPAELRAAWGERAPDCVFSSPPCKGFSRLLSTKASQTDKYQALNRLVLQGLFLLCETWGTPPALLVVENVPGIMSRGAALLAQVRQLLTGYGYALHEGMHDCGEIGGLAQHRRRYLLVARLPSKVSAYVYRPPVQTVRACGSVLETLPMPGDESAGALHQLPKLSWLNWVRLALIPAGKDWRALPKDAGELSLRITAARAESWKGRPGLLGVQPWEEPAPAVADPRLTCRPRAGAYGVLSWWEAASTITGSLQVDNGRAAVADPRAEKAPAPVIIAEDGTWHRPITTLELAALQGIPAKVQGAPLKLAGRSTAKHRERIGNAVPVGAARAIAESLLKALLASALGIWTLGATGIWVRDDGRSEDELAVEAAA